MIKSAEAVPPLCVSAYAIAVFLGALKPESGKVKTVEDNAVSVEQFIAMFGSQGTMTTH